MNHKPRPYKGYALIDRACGWAAATVFVLTIAACIAAIVTDTRQDAAKPCVTAATVVVAETERPLLPVEYISLTVETAEVAETRSYNGITEGDVIVSELTYYDVCKHCCGKTDGVTASGLIIANGVEPNMPVASCNWLPLGSIVSIDGVEHVIADRGGKGLNEVGRLDIFEPRGHRQAQINGRVKGVEVIILRLGEAE